MSDSYSHDILDWFPSLTGDWYPARTMKAVKEKAVHMWIERHGERYYIFCPGCYEYYNSLYPDEPRWRHNNSIHCIRIGVHTFNGNLFAPTFTPSVLEKSADGKIVCHSFVTDGRIQYLSDCTHPLAGQTVDLMDVPEEYKEP